MCVYIYIQTYMCIVYANPNCSHSRHVNVYTYIPRYRFCRRAPPHNLHLSPPPPPTDGTDVIKYVCVRVQRTLCSVRVFFLHCPRIVVLNSKYTSSSNYRRDIFGWLVRGGREKNSRRFAEIDISGRNASGTSNKIDFKSIFDAI